MSIIKDLQQRIREVVDKTSDQAYLRDRADRKWVKFHLSELIARYPEQYIAVQNQQVMGAWPDLNAAQAATRHLNPHEYIRLRGLRGESALQAKLQETLRRWSRERQYILPPVLTHPGLPVEPNREAPGIFSLIYDLLADYLGGVWVTWPTYQACHDIPEDYRKYLKG